MQRKNCGCKVRVIYYGDDPSSQSGTGEEQPTFMAAQFAVFLVAIIASAVVGYYGPRLALGGVTNPTLYLVAASAGLAVSLLGGLLLACWVVARFGRCPKHGPVDWEKRRDEIAQMLAPVLDTWDALLDQLEQIRWNVFGTKDKWKRQSWPETADPWRLSTLLSASVITVLVGAGTGWWYVTHRYHQAPFGTPMWAVIAPVLTWFVAWVITLVVVFYMAALVTVLCRPLARWTFLCFMAGAPILLRCAGCLLVHILKNLMQYPGRIRAWFVRHIITERGSAMAVPNTPAQPDPNPATPDQEVLELRALARRSAQQGTTSGLTRREDLEENMTNLREELVNLQAERAELDRVHAKACADVDSEIDGVADELAKLQAELDGLDGKSRSGSAGGFSFKFKPARAQYRKPPTTQRRSIKQRLSGS